MYDRDKLLLTVYEAAYILNCSSATIYKLINSGQLRYKNQGKAFRILAEDVENYARLSSHYKKPEASNTDKNPL